MRPKEPNRIKQKRGILFFSFLTFSLSYFLTFCCAAEQATNSVRLPVVAGSFYPSDEKELRAMVQTYLKQAGGVTVAGKIRGLVAPHAGYIYSGIVAAAGYKQIDPAVRTVIIMAPSHRTTFPGASIPEVSSYRTPFGDIPLAKGVSELRGHPVITSVKQAHIGEHSLEVQLPFLQEVLGRFDLIPLVVGDVDPQVLANAILPYIKENTLVVASSDLSHYYPYKKAVSMDRICTKAISSLDFDAMPHCEACGKIPVLTLMHIARMKGWKGALIDYKNSGDTGGPKSRVVGYASIAFTAFTRPLQNVQFCPRSRKMKILTAGILEVFRGLKSEFDVEIGQKGMFCKGLTTGGIIMSTNEKNELPATERAFLLKLARTAITASLKNQKLTINPEDVPEALKEKRGCFVTLHIGERLRGCIGTILPVESLYEGVRKNALNAAFRDPRFPPLTLNELEKVHLEISVLTVPRTISFSDGEDLKRQLRPNIHGVILSQGGRSSTFLPQVWEQLPDKEDFLEHLCLKGWMDKTCWKDPKTKVETYEAEVFSE